MQLMIYKYTDVIRPRITVPCINKVKDQTWEIGFKTEQGIVFCCVHISFDIYIYYILYREVIYVYA